MSETRQVLTIESVQSVLDASDVATTQATSAASAASAAALAANTAAANANPNIPTLASISDLRSVDTTSTLQGTRVDTMGYYSPGDGGGNSFYWESTSAASDNGGTIIRPSSNPAVGRWVAVENATFSLRQFGTVGDGVADDTAFIQNALNALPDSGTLFVTDFHKVTGGLTCDQNRITIQGRNGYTLPLIYCDASSTNILTLGGFGTALFDVSFRGDGGENGVGATNSAVRYVRSDGSKDIDAKMRNAFFEGFDRAVYVQGTNLEVNSCNFTACLEGVHFARNASDESRGLRVFDCRFHSMGQINTVSKCIVLNSDAFDCQVADNFADAVYTFFEGPVNGIKIDGNLIYRCAGEAISCIEATFTVQQRNGSVSNNTIFQNAPSYVGNGILLRIRNGVCVGNNIVGSRNHGIEMINVTDSIVSDNNILQPNFNPGDDGVIYDGISGGITVTGNLIANNRIRTFGGSGRFGINLSSDTNILVNNLVTGFPNAYSTVIPIVDVSSSQHNVNSRISRQLNPGVVTANPNERNDWFSRSVDDTFQAGSFRTVVRSSTAGAERADYQFWVSYLGVLMNKVNILGDGGLEIVDSAWNDKPFKIGNYFVWVDASDRLRIKSGAPSSDTDGTVVGAQS